MKFASASASGAGAGTPCAGDVRGALAMPVGPGSRTAGLATAISLAAPAQCTALQRPACALHHASNAGLVTEVGLNTLGISTSVATRWERWARAQSTAASTPSSTRSRPQQRHTTVPTSAACARAHAPWHVAAVRRARSAAALSTPAHWLVPAAVLARSGAAPAAGGGQDGAGVVRAAAGHGRHGGLQ